MQRPKTNPARFQEDDSDSLHNHVQSVCSFNKTQDELEDAPLPKRPLTAYLIFSKDIRKDIVRQNPDANPTEIIKKISLLWKELPQDERLKFLEKAEQDRQRYDQEMELHNQYN
eukprot:TRINITY_DN2537_c0_g4_i1.p3 TRINITY_DN2537_c0_g4~~TRINITY_DN2537_c0_g4_i1.p3  ORF type:complete len:114 (-),score=8.99 TRINITY_DN2537_c0_g4_i1:513-854(-)